MKVIVLKSSDVGKQCIKKVINACYTTISLEGNFKTVGLLCVCVFVIIYVFFFLMSSIVIFQFYRIFGSIPAGYPARRDLAV